MAEKEPTPNDTIRREALVQTTLHNEAPSSSIFKSATHPKREELQAEMLALGFRRRSGVSACSCQHGWLGWVLSHADVTIISATSPDNTWGGGRYTIPGCAGHTCASALQESHRRALWHHLHRLHAGSPFPGKERHHRECETQTNEGERCMWRTWIASQLHQLWFPINSGSQGDSNACFLNSHLSFLCFIYLTTTPQFSVLSLPYG